MTVAQLSSHFEQFELSLAKPGELYSAEVFKFSPSLSWGKPEWATSKPMNTNDLIRELLALGFHQINMGDAFYAADRDWLQQSLEMGRGDMVILKECPAGLLEGSSRGRSAGNFCDHLQTSSTQNVPR